MKKYLLILVIVIATLALLAVGLFFVFKGKKGSQRAPTPTPETGKLIETTLDERPYVTLAPRSDGKELTLEISRIKNADTIDYELTYLAGDLSRGVIGTITPQEETTVSRKLLLGSCSKNVCKYDENIEQGTLVLKFRAEDGVRKFTSDFHLQNGVKELSMNDGSFKLESSVNLNSYYITMSTIGLPEDFNGQVEAGPYGIFSSGSTTIKGATIVFSPANDSAKIYLWTKNEWVEAKANTVPTLTTYIFAIPASE